MGIPLLLYPRQFFPIPNSWFHTVVRRWLRPNGTFDNVTLGLPKGFADVSTLLKLSVLVRQEYQDMPLNWVNTIRI